MQVSDEQARDAVKLLLHYIGENPERPGLIDTPKRVVNMFKEIYRGYNPEMVPKVAVFNNSDDGLAVDQMVCDQGGFYSNCEHHMVPIIGHYWFAYIPHPNGLILGLSKVARVFDYVAAKLQIQERIAEDVHALLIDALTEGGKYPAPLGMATVIEATHLCKTMRGVKKEGTMRTIKLEGAFLEGEVRAEFLGWASK